MTVKLTLQGGRQLDAALRELKTVTARRVGDRAMVAALKPVLDDAVRMAPVGDHTADHARRFHYVETLGIGKKLNASQAAAEKKISGVPAQHLLMRYVGSSSPLAHLFEFGTGQRRHKDGSSTGRMAPHPHMRAAWDANLDAVFNTMVERLGIEVDKAAKRAAKKALKAKAGV